MDLHSHINLSFLHMNSSSYGAPLFVDFKFFLSYSLASFFFSFSFLSFYLVIFGMTFMKLFGLGKMGT